MALVRVFDGEIKMGQMIKLMHNNENHSVLELVKQMSLHWDQVRWRDISKSANGPYESGLLKLNCDKALHYLGWCAVMSFEETVRMTAEWYGSYYKKSNEIGLITKDQIDAYTAIARQEGLSWAQVV
jgi:CDP-glucose 4,6-dehydratase